MSVKRMRRSMQAPYVYGLGDDDDPRLLNGTPGDAHGMTVTTEQIMGAFDGLRRNVRRALASANQPWAPHWAEFEVWFHASSAVVERIERADREEAQRREMRLLRGLAELEMDKTTALRAQRIEAGERSAR